MNNYKYKFSVIVPIYNVEQYLDETIQSVINQDIGFKENIQMILVNDGSRDNSEDICLKYKEKYPQNIIYIKQKNAGVSTARNNGMKYIEGKYTNFLDSDDKWEKNAFSKVWSFFEKKYDQINLVACRMKFFEAKETYHTLDYKFDKDRVVDIFEDYQDIQLHVTSSFIKSEILLNYKFNEQLKYGEDAEFITEIIVDKTKYGVMKNVTNYYRKRINNSSAVQGKENKIEWYTDSIELFCKKIAKFSYDLYGEVIPYVQYVIMYELRWRIFTKISKILKEEQKKEYIKNIRELLNLIDDKIIFMLKHTSREQKIYCANLKYGKDIRKEFSYDHTNIKFNNINVANIRNKNFMEITLISVKGNKLYLEGKIRNTFLKEDYKIYVKDNKNKKYFFEYYNIPYSRRVSFDGNLYFEYIGFKVVVPIEKIKQMRIMITYRENYNGRLHLHFNKLSGMNEKVNNMYLVKNNYILSTKGNKIYIEKKTKSKRLKKEIKYLWELLKQKQYKIIEYRILYYIFKRLNKKPIWIISDRTKQANDNGMHMFKYLTKYEKEAKVYFVIDKKAKDYKKMKKVGKVLPYGTFKYRLYFLLSSKVISSQADDWVINAFADKEIYMRDLYKFKFVFLQHGITKDDISSWLHKLNKNISIFVTSAQRECESIISGRYGYTNKNVKLLGFPRYDDLKDETKKQIVFMPTWRNNLDWKLNSAKGEREYNPYFKQSEYYKFYNKLINDQRIIKILKEKEYTAKFCIHPSFEKQWIDFQGNEYVKVETEKNYQKEFAENALLITDYSSVAFDFAYLKKPIIYSQFDKETFFEGHIYNEGYFKYEKDGFGPVCYDYESTVQTIIDYIENDCKIEDQYLERINNFYTYTDKNNCKRVYEEIISERKQEKMKKLKNVAAVHTHTHTHRALNNIIAVIISNVFEMHKNKKTLNFNQSDFIKNQTLVLV